MEVRKLILQQAAKAIKILHDNHWIHFDVKPDVVMLDWSRHEDKEEMRIDRVALSDMDYASPMTGGREPWPGPYGTPEWRSPEGQVYGGWGYHSDVFSFGLVCLFTVTGARTTHPSFKGLKEDGISPSRYVLSCLFHYFGPPPEGLLRKVGGEKAKVMIRIWEEDYQNSVGENELGRFQEWDEHRFPLLDPDTKRFLSRILNLDPAKRPTITEVLEDPWWK
ncbi:hypothetical protein SLS62_000729 [Diatrype stigma]|uniref:Protein kinase domain-containing protein n=1 Tax=Diatrype stigma TaxID=117547 RepID=A0AAN9V325_9PEZI